MADTQKELRWVPCECCGGSGEHISSKPVGAYEEPYDYAVICPACEGTGRYCVEVEPITIDDLAANAPPTDQPATQ